jgi:hypothetical protein
MLIKIKIKINWQFLFVHKFTPSNTNKIFTPRDLLAGIKKLTM